MQNNELRIHDVAAELNKVAANTTGSWQMLSGAMVWVMNDWLCNGLGNWNGMQARLARQVIVAFIDDAPGWVAKNLDDANANPGGWNTPGIPRHVTDASIIALTNKVIAFLSR